MLKDYKIFYKFHHKLFRGELTEKQAEEFVACRDKMKERGLNGEKLAGILIKKSMQKAFVTCVYDI